MLIQPPSRQGPHSTGPDVPQGRLGNLEPVQEQIPSTTLRRPARDQLTDAILYVSALELRCAKQLEDDSNLPLPPFLHGKMGERSRPSDRH